MLPDSYRASRKFGSIRPMSRRLPKIATPPNRRRNGLGCLNRRHRGRLWGLQGRLLGPTGAQPPRTHALGVIVCRGALGLVRGVGTVSMKQLELHAGSGEWRHARPPSTFVVSTPHAMGRGGKVGSLCPLESAAGSSMQMSCGPPQANGARPIDAFGAQIETRRLSNQRATRRSPTLAARSIATAAGELKGGVHIMRMRSPGWASPACCPTQTPIGPAETREGRCQREDSLSVWHLHEGRRTAGLLEGATLLRAGRCSAGRAQRRGAGGREVRMGWLRR